MGSAEANRAKEEEEKQKKGLTQTKTGIKEESEIETEKTLILSPPRRNNDKSHILKSETRKLFLDINFF